MKIAIATTGRFHVLDLARELDALGHEVAFYSYVPRERAVRFGLPARCHRPLLPYVAPLAAALRFGPGKLKPALDHLMLRTVDRLEARHMEPCDVFIGMSGLCVRSAKAAMEKYNATVFIERGSRHILSQKETLDALAARSREVGTVPDYAVRRELASYEAADVIVVPSRHAEESFVERGYPKWKLFRNPYGVDLSMFPPTPAPSLDVPVIIHVGAWSFRKGCDVLSTAWRRLKACRLFHVGPVGDAPLPGEPGFEHHDPVPQWKLVEFYSKAHVFVLASREDGFGMVLSQALACGLPVVCTDRTGGEDLKEFLDDPSMITIVLHDDPDALADALRVSLHRARRQGGIRDILGKAREKLSWRAYGLRYHQFISGPAVNMCRNK